MDNNVLIGADATFGVVQRNRLASRPLIAEALEQSRGLRFQAIAFELLREALGRVAVGIGANSRKLIGFRLARVAAAWRPIGRRVFLRALALGRRGGRRGLRKGRAINPRRLRARGDPETLHQPLNLRS